MGRAGNLQPGFEPASSLFRVAPREGFARRRRSGVGSGKIVLLGEHAVVYGSHALAAPISLQVRAWVKAGRESGVELRIPAWGISGLLHTSAIPLGLGTVIDLILEHLQLTEHDMLIDIDAQVPRAMGLGGSAALAVAIIRALSGWFDLALTDADVDALAFKAEELSHGRPSGVDNALATFGRCLLFQKGAPARMCPVQLPVPVPLVIGMSRIASLTAQTVAHVYDAWQKNTEHYDALFRDIDELTLRATSALENADFAQLGALMNKNHTLLQALDVSSPQLDELVSLAREHGALGAKLTGGGGGGAMIALCPDSATQVMQAMTRAGYRSLLTVVG